MYELYVEKQVELTLISITPNSRWFKKYDFIVSTVKGKKQNSKEGKEELRKKKPFV